MSVRRLVFLLAVVGTAPCMAADALTAQRVKQVDESVDRALAWLAQRQRADGGEVGPHEIEGAVGGAVVYVNDLVLDGRHILVEHRGQAVLQISPAVKPQHDDAGLGSSFHHTATCIACYLSQVRTIALAIPKP